MIIIIIIIILHHFVLAKLATSSMLLMLLTSMHLDSIFAWHILAHNQILQKFILISWSYGGCLDGRVV